MSPEENMIRQFKILQEKAFQNFLEVTTDLAIMQGKQPAEEMFEFLREKMGNPIED